MNYRILDLILLGYFYLAHDDHNDDFQVHSSELTDRRYHKNSFSD
jgi:hypothetical protein